MATRSHFSRLLRHASHALASHSAATTSASPQQCRALVQPQTRLDAKKKVGSFARRIDGRRIAFGGARERRMFGSAPHEEEKGSAGDSEAEEYEWEEEEEEEEVEEEEEEEYEDGDAEALEALDSDSDDASPELQQPRKASGRDPDYSMRIEAPIDEIYALLHSRGFISARQKRPTPNDSVLGHEDHRIVAWYRRVGVGLLNYYSSCDNFLKVKAMVNYQLRWSAIHTLSKKHKSSSRQVIQKYGKNLVVTREGTAVASFLSVAEIKQHRKGFLEIDPVPPETLIDVLFSRMNRRSRDEKKKRR